MGRLKKQIWFSYQQGESLLDELEKLESHMIESRFNENAKERSDEFKRAMKIVEQIKHQIMIMGDYQG